MKALYSFTESCAKICKFLLVVLLPILAAVVFLQVVMRYVFGNALFWAEEVARYAMVWACCLGTCVAVRTDEHIRLVFVLNKLSRKNQGLITLIFELVTLVFFVITGWYSGSLSITEWHQVSAAMQIPMTFIYSSICAMSIISSIFLIENIAKKTLPAIKKSHPSG
jgi:TRAP-type C4-dicarboxylate transport system permease small subunit